MDPTLDEELGAWDQRDFSADVTLVESLKRRPLVAALAHSGVVGFLIPGGHATLTSWLTEAFLQDT